MEDLAEAGIREAGRYRDLAEIFRLTLRTADLDPARAAHEIAPLVADVVEARLEQASRRQTRGEADSGTSDIRSVAAERQQIAAALEPIVRSWYEAAAALAQRARVVESLTRGLTSLDQIAGLSPSVLEAIARLLPAAAEAEPVRAAFAARALNALARLTPQASEQVLGAAAGAATDLAVLVRVLEDPSALTILKQEDPLAAARLRGLAVREQLLQTEGGALTVEEAARQLGISRQAVDKRRRSGHLIGLDVGRRGYAYPAWQFGERGILKGLELILDDMTVRDPWMQAAFFLSGDPRLDGARPVDELRRGNVEDVRRAARGYGEHAAA